MSKYKLDMNLIQKQASTPNLKIELKKHQVKGYGLFAKKLIKKGEVIAFYKVTVYYAARYKSPTNNIYTFNVYKLDGNENKRYIGDIDNNSFPKPINNISFLAPFANEPSEKENEVINSEMDYNLDENYKNRKIVKVGDTLIYNLIALKNIKKGEEVLWYYGDEYVRDY